LPPPGALHVESSFDGLPGRIGIGTFDLCGRELRFDALSEARLERAIDLVSVLLAGNAELIHREIAPIDLHRPARADASAVAEADALGSGYLEEYLRRWLDEPLARLEGATPRPRQASRSFAARLSSCCARSRTAPSMPTAPVQPGPTSGGCATSSASRHSSPRRHPRPEKRPRQGDSTSRKRRCGVRVHIPDVVDLTGISRPPLRDGRGHSGFRLALRLES